MRIAFVSADASSPAFGRMGCSVHMQSIIRGFRDLGHVVELFIGRLGGEVPIGLRDLPIHPLPRPERPAVPSESWAPLSANAHLFSSLGDAGGFDLVYERASLWSFAALEWAKRRGVPSILEVNAPAIDHLRRYAHPQELRVAEQIAQRAAQTAGAIRAVSSGVARSLECFSGAAGKTRIIPNGVAPERFPRGLQPMWSPGRRSFTVGFVGGLQPASDLPTLIRGFDLLTSRNTDCHLLIIGEGAERERLESLAEDLGVAPRVRFTGAVPVEDIPHWLASMDVAVSLSEAGLEFPGSPLNEYEYMAAGLPAVVTSVDEPTRPLRDGLTGITIPPSDPRALATALSRLRCNAELRARLGANARAVVRREHTWSERVGRVLSLATPRAPGAVPIRELESHG